MNDITRVGQTSGFRETPSQTGNEHIVQRGDTLWGIAQQHRVSLGQLEAANPQLAKNDFIFPGDRITIPDAGSAVHVVRAGQTVGQIATLRDVSSRDIVQANNLRNPDLIHPGDRLIIPRGTAPVVSSEQPAPTGPRPSVPAPTETPVATNPTTTTTEGNTNLRNMFDPALGSAALGAVIIGQAEGTRTPDGGYRNAYYGHVDPGNGVGNRGSFSLQNAGSLTPQQADTRQLERLNQQIPAFEAAATAAGLDPNNAALSTAYLDLYNQSPTAAARFVTQLDYLTTNGVSTENLVELRFRSFVDHSTGERFRLPSGSAAGGGFVNIARRELGREPTEAEVQSVILRDQNRRVTAMAAALPDAGVAPAASAPETGPARFTSNPGIDLTQAATERANALSDAVREETGYALHVTSGRRAPDRQAAAMYNNFVERDSPTYANRAAFNEVREAYDSGRAEGLDRTAIIERMTNVLQAQVDRGVLISRHISDRAIDIRLPPANSRAEVLAAIRDNPAVQSVGVENDHFHIQFR